MKRIINNIWIRWLVITHQNTSSLNWLYIAQEYWYRLALDHLGYLDRNTPEGLPERTTGLLTWYQIESNEKFYNIVLTHIYLKECCDISFKQLSPMMSKDLIDQMKPNWKEENNHEHNFWWGLNYQRAIKK